MSPETDGDLLQAYLDGTLPAERVATLEARLQHEPELCRQLIRLGRDEGILREWACSTHQTTHPGQPLPGPHQFSPGGIWRWGSAAAALLLALLGSLYFLLPPLPHESPSPAPIALLEEVQGQVYLVVAGQQQQPVLEALTSGRELFPGQELRTQGEQSFAIIRYRDNTRLELGVDTAVRLSEEPALRGRPTSHKVTLLEGILGAEATRQNASPLLLSTPHAEVIAPGGKVNCWSLPRLTRIESVEGQALVKRSGEGQAIAAPSGTYLLAAPDNKTVQARPQAVLQLQPRWSVQDSAGPILALEFLPGGRQLLAGGWKGMLQILDVASGAVQGASETGHRNQVRGLAVPAVGGWVASAGQDRLLRLWNLQTVQEVKSWRPHRQAFHAVAVAPDGRSLATVGGNRTLGEVKLTDPQTGNLIASLSGHTSEVLTVAFSPDGHLLATGGRDRAVRFWNAHTGAPVRNLPEHLEDILTLTFSADSRQFASASRDGLVKLWDVGTGREQLAFLASPRGVRSLSFSPDGEILAVAGLEPAVRLFDTSRGREIMVAKGHNYQGCAVRFGPDGRTLATSGWDRTVKLWDMPTR